MSRILLADDSPHAQRMGERILRDEGFEVVTATDGDAALSRLEESDPDLVLADVYLPGKSGYEVCEFVKAQSRHRHTRVVLIAGLLEHVDETEVARVGADAVLRKPFEASAMLSVIRPMTESAARLRSGASAGRPDERAETALAAAPAAAPAAVAPQAATSDLDPERVRAAVTLALDRAMPALIDEITERVLIALGR